MAQVKIYALKTTLDQYRNQISDAIHEAVMDALQYPPDKRFHRFLPLDEINFIFPDDRSEKYTVMNLEIGIGLHLGWEYLRVGRKLRTLPTLQALFRAGKLSWSKVRLISRVADADNERTLCHAALDASVSGVEQLCAGYRWQKERTIPATTCLSAEPTPQY